MLSQTSTPPGSWSLNDYGYIGIALLIEDSHDRELTGGGRCALAGKELTQ
jgi:hypothetical protein